MRQVVWTLAAESDVQAVYERLEDFGTGIGDRFYTELLSSIKLLEIFPETGPVVYGNSVRRVLVFNRNYGLFYISERRGIILHALLDLRQDPQSVINRLSRL